MGNFNRGPYEEHLGDFFFSNLSQETSSKDIFYFSSENHFVKWSQSILTNLVEGIIGDFLVKIF